MNASNNDKQDLYNTLVLTRMICSVISIPFCIVIIVLYCVLCCQVMFNKRKSTLELTSEDTQITPNATTKVSLGNHFMFLLILFNLISSIIPIIFFFTFYKQNSAAGHETLCKVLGFFHNFFDGCACCVTSFIVFLFYISTKITEFKPGQERKYMIFGILYFILATTFFTTLPFVSTEPPYGWAYTHCSFNYKEYDKTNNEQVSIWKYWNYVYSAFVFINCVINSLFLVIVSRYYYKKLKKMDSDSHEYKMIRRFVFIFSVFPFVLVLSRIAKGLARMNDIYIFHYAGTYLYCLNGLFNSLICFYFFRGVFKCLKEEKEEPMIRKDAEHTISMQQIHEDNIEDDD